MVDRLGNRAPRRLRASPGSRDPLRGTSRRPGRSCELAAICDVPSIDLDLGADGYSTERWGPEPRGYRLRPHLPGQRETLGAQPNRSPEERVDAVAEDAHAGFAGIAAEEEPEGRRREGQVLVGQTGSAHAVAGSRSPAGLLKPSLEVGLPHDGGDADTGAGMNVVAGLAVSDSTTRLSVDVRVPVLVGYWAAGFRERGWRCR